MSNTQKFLDYDGVKYLWSKISMEDYPNNETLIAVLNAIDETKADKTYVDDAIDNIDIYDTIEIGNNTAGMNLQNDGEEIYWTPEGYARAKGDLLSINAITKTKLDIITKLTAPRDNSNDWFRPLKKIHLNHITGGTNLLDLFNGEVTDTDTSQIYYPGTVIEKSGITATINDNSSATILGTANSGGCLIINARWDSANRNKFLVLPAGTYVTHKRLIINLNSLSENIHKQVSGQFTLTEPHYLRQILINCNEGSFYNETIPLGIYIGSSIPEDTLYHGNIYWVEFSNIPPMNAKFNWSSGELISEDGSIIETVAPTNIITMNGANTFISGYGTNIISYAINNSDKALNHIVLTDAVTGINYKITVVNGKLTMQEVL